MENRRITTGTWKNTPRTQELIQEVLDSGRTSYGDKSRKFEQEFAQVHDCKYGTLSNSGTSSLQVALQAMKEIHGWEDGDEVIVPATTFVATPNVVIHNGMVPVFVDIEPNFYGINPSLIEEKITDKTRAIIPVHLFGQSCDMVEIMKIAHYHNIVVIEDSCETMFVSNNGMKVGSIGDIGCFSTYNAHLISAGVGGISTTNYPEYAAKMRSLVNHGLSEENLNLDDNMQPQPMVGRKFNFDSIGHSYRITEFEAAVALAQLEGYETMVAKRRKIANQILGDVLAATERVYKLPYSREFGEHSRMMFPLVIEKYNGKIIDKKPVTDFLNSKGIETRDMLPLLGQTAYKEYMNPADYPVSDHIEKSGFYVGCHQGLSNEDVKYLIDRLDETVSIITGEHNDN